MDNLPCIHHIYYFFLLSLIFLVLFLSYLNLYFLSLDCYILLQLLDDHLYYLDLFLSLLLYNFLLQLFWLYLFHIYINMALFFALLFLLQYFHLYLLLSTLDLLLVHFVLSHLSTLVLLIHLLFLFHLIVFSHYMDNLPCIHHKKNAIYYFLFLNHSLQQSPLYRYYIVVLVPFYLKYFLQFQLQLL